MKREEIEDEGGWMHISDMMSVLMMIFLFVSVVYMLDVRKERDKMKSAAVAYNVLQRDLYVDLDREFKDDLRRWNAVIDKKELSVRFMEPDVLFNVGSAEIKEEFKLILDDFFPRYIEVLRSKKYIDNIEEIRIEGHTSTDWAGESDLDEAYIKNMQLSQDRTRNVLKYSLSLIDGDRWWVKSKLTSNGLSSSKIVSDSMGVEDKALSRRVEFRVRTDAVNVIDVILNN